MIKLAKTEEEITRCLEYLTGKGLNPLEHATYIYSEREGRITACIGIVYIAMLEPFACDNAVDGLRVSEQATGMARKDLHLAGGMLTEESLKEMESVYAKMDFQEWGKNVNLFIKEL